ncbi:hypothetical protein CCACVL1_07938 [Corchorus capsularis]|uniref:Uncharacterized protein n=1 Tax=Corchorus capsularis TaxID=210143 RepID=A0A1R3J367_COCAP|nr:hypothetical protein CCACVL1_07938 [Corchorus capsularis]
MHGLTHSGQIPANFLTDMSLISTNGHHSV